MGQETVKLTRDRELRLRRRLDRIQELTIAGVVPFSGTMSALRELLKVFAPDDPVLRDGAEPRKKRDLAEERRAAVEAAFHKRGHTIVVVPKPAASNRNFTRWERENRALFYHPANDQMTYEAFMASVGQGEHWTVADEADRAKIGWESSAEGYWFTAEIAPVCPRLKTSRNDLTAAVKLSSLEEYAIVYWTHRDLTGERIDISTWCWLRTRYGQDSLGAGADVGGVEFGKDFPAYPSVPYDAGGGRAVEVVANAA